jgi:DNA invertase Pin-like site-specific DNA recombinase
MKEVDSIVLDMPLLDTQKREGFNGDIPCRYCPVSLFIAQNERETIRKRQAQEVAAKAKGIKFPT